MNRRFRLSAVLRARKAQEDSAKAAVLAANATAQAAEDKRYAKECALLALPTIDGGPAGWYLAAVSSRQALAAELTAAARLADEATAAVAERVAELTAAAIRRRSMETLAERHADTVVNADLAAEQQEMDELATSRRPDGGMSR